MFLKNGLSVPFLMLLNRPPVLLHFAENEPVAALLPRRHEQELRGISRLKGEEDKSQSQKGRKCGMEGCEADIGPEPHAE